MTIDERRKTVFAIIKFEFIDRKTGEVLVVERGATQYQLVLDENGSIKIKSFVFFPQRVAPGTLTGADVFRGIAAKLLGQVISIEDRRGHLADQGGSDSCQTWKQTGLLHPRRRP